MAGRPPGHSSLPRNSPVRREQVNVDPLLEASASAGTPPVYHPQQSRPVSEGTGDALSHIRQNSPSADPIQVEAENFLAGCMKFPLNVKGVPQNLSGLCVLAESCAWKGVVNLSKTLLFQDESTSEQDLIRISCIRFEALFRMKLYDELTVEVGNVLNSEEKRVEAEKVQQQQAQVAGEAPPSNVAFQTKSQQNLNLTVSMRLLLYEVKMMTGRSQEALEKLLLLSKWLSDLEVADGTPTAVVSFWLWQVRCHIVNAHIRLRNWKAAALDLQAMIVDLDRYMSNNDCADEKAALMKAKIILLLKTARVLLQIGAIHKSTLCYEQASALVAHDAEHHAAPNVSVRDAQIQAQLLLTQGLLLFSADKYGQALDTFTTILDSSVASTAADADSFFASAQSAGCMSLRAIFVSAAGGASRGGVGPGAAVASVLAAFDDQQQPTLVAATNNCAVCALYVKRIHDAVRHLESLIKIDPARNMTDPVVFNLCTLYDLSFSADVSTQRKKVLQRIAAKYHVDDPILHWRSFRLNS